ncbi:MAG: type II toxin-antitoxin system HicB family antitoxin [Oscillospiraceae bacterium]|nr:type II toxin-antitoxin system HicB family antitoxin [Oscillospiraceae bacterium]
MKVIYPAVFHREGDGYWADFPDLEGCQSFGSDIEDTLSNLREALEGYVISLIENNETVPSPSDISDITDLDGGEFVTLVDADLSAYANRSKAVKKTLTIPEWLNEAAIRQNLNFSQILQDALLTKLAR